MKQRLGRADQRPERDEPEVLVEPKLACGRRDHGGIAAARSRRLPHFADQPRQRRPTAELLLHREQAQLAQTPPRGDVRFEAADLRLDRKGAVETDRDHPDHPLIRDADDVDILLVELVDPPPRRFRTVLWDLLGEGDVVQSMDLLELPRLSRDPELEAAWRPAHLSFVQGLVSLDSRFYPSAAGAGHEFATRTGGRRRNLRARVSIGAGSSSIRLEELPFRLELIATSWRRPSASTRGRG